MGVGKIGAFVFRRRGGTTEKKQKVSFFIRTAKNSEKHRNYT